MKYVTNRRINVRTIRNIADNPGRLAGRHNGHHLQDTRRGQRAPPPRFGSKKQYRHLVLWWYLLYRYQQEISNQKSGSGSRQNHEPAEHLRMASPEKWSAGLVLNFK